MMAHRHVKPVYVVYGPNVYLRRKALDGIIERELSGGDPALNLARVDGSKVDIAEVLDDVRTLSMLGDRRVVVVDDADSFIKKYRQALERFTQSPSDSGCLVLICSGFDARTRLYKAVKRIGQAIECRPISGGALLSWLASSARQTYQKRMSRQAAARLCDHVGPSQEALDAELAKLALYVAGRSEITVEDVDAVVAHYREQTIFAVVDAIASGDARTAIEEWQQVLATDRAAPGRAIGGLAWGVRRLLDARRKLDQGTSIGTLARQFRTDPDTLTRRMDRVTVRKLQDQLADLLHADLESKTGLGVVGMAVEKFIVKHSSAVGV